MLDFVIKGGTIIDGTGADSFSGDVGVQDGRIVELGTVNSKAAQTINADGAIVSPGWIDIHTHYDGQVAWDTQVAPSSSHGVTTIVMGNCGVGFAPVRPGEHEQLIEVMEGVEDIPGSALNEGIPWGQWETFEEYMDFLETREYALDVGAQLPHGALRSYVMGKRNSLDSNATAADIEEMGKHIERAMRAGAMGLSTSRTIGHRSLTGEPVPGTFAADDELMGFAAAMKRAGRGVFEVIPANVIGELKFFGGEKKSTLEEIALMGRFSRESGRKVTFTQLQISESTDRWRYAFEATEKENANGALLHPQVAGRGVGMLTSFRTYHMFMRRKSYIALDSLSEEDRIRELLKPEVKAQILADEDIPHPSAGSMKNIYRHFKAHLHQTFGMRHTADYEPEGELSIAAQAKANGKNPEELMYDQLCRENGTAFSILLGSNYYEHSLDALREMIKHPDSVSGLGDAGAHVNFIADGAMPSFSLIHWVRDRSRGEKLPIELVVHKQTGANAALYDMHDRGEIKLGKRADLNVIELEKLKLQKPQIVADLPAGGTRILQEVDGYIGTWVNGVQTRADGKDLGARPGRLVRGGH